MTMVVTKENITRYWEDNDYSALQKADINDFCRMWGREEGIELADSFDIAEYNSLFFTKINSEKHAVNLILEKFKYPIAKTESLTWNLEVATQRAIQLFKENKFRGVIRANKFAGGGGTFIIKNINSIPMMISTLLNHPNGPIIPLFSPYYFSPVEYGVFVVNGKVELVIAKHLNEETGLHNLSLGAEASVVTNEDKINELESICRGISEIFGIGFGRIDILETEQGLKIIELSVPNFKKFAMQDEKSLAAAKKLFLTYHYTFN